MEEHPILNQVSLGYSPMIDRERAVIATRLTVFPLRPDALLDPRALLDALGEVWPAGGKRVSLNVANETLLNDLLNGTMPSTNVMIEVPAFMACDEINTEALLRLHAAGNSLLIKGRPLQELPRELLPCFTHSIVDLSDDRRMGRPAPEGVTRTISHVQSGIRTLAELELSFERGAVAVLGWPIDDALGVNENKDAGKAKAKGDRNTRPDMQVVVELIHRVDQGEDIDRLEATLKRDPALAFKLLKYMNSPGVGLNVEVSSFRHAIMLMGYNKLKRWLALLLATAGKDNNLRPVMFAAVRRGMLMEELARGNGDDAMRSESFICGVFSLLDKMFGQPFAELLETVPVPERVYQALVHESGPHRALMDLVLAIETESFFDMRDSADRLMMSPGEINRAVLRALAAASALE